MNSPHIPTELSLRPPLLVLGVEQEWAARSLETVLGPHGFAFVRGRSGRQTLELALSVNPDVVLIDSRLSDVDGVEVCRRLRETGQLGAHVPIVLMTSAAAPREFLRDAYLAGAWSVWEQPLDGELLILRLRTWIEAKRAVDTAERTRHLDAEHGMYTYRGLQHRVRELVADAARRQTPVACIAVGALGTAGQGAGMERPVSAAAATDVARAVAELARASDVVGQVGEGEFAILAPMTGSDGAATIVERLRDRVATLPVYLEEGEPVRVFLRAGIATIDAPDAANQDGADLLQRAATALRFAHAARSADVPTFADVPVTFV